MAVDRYCYPARRDSVAFSNVQAVFGIVVLGICCWLLNIAVPEWADKLLGYFRH